MYVSKNENKNHMHDVSPVMFRIACSILGTYSNITSENPSRRLKSLGIHCKRHNGVLFNSYF